MSPKPSRGTKPLTSSVFYILLALADNERHGLGIAADIAERTDGDVELGPGTLYSSMQKMLDACLIEESNAPGSGKHDPRRRYYRITRLGREALRAEAERLERLVDTARDKHVLKTPRPA